jgi:hypothetical protein
VYLSFLGLVWFTPVVTADRALLIVIWTAYIIVGSRFKDLRMTEFIGDSYRDYRLSVFGFLPLRRFEFTLPEATECPVSNGQRPDNSNECNRRAA